MKDTELLAALKEHYPIAFERVERLRDAGSTTYAAYAERENYFVKLTKPAFGDTVEGAVQLHLFLQGRGIPVPRLIAAEGERPFVRLKDGAAERCLLLYEYLDLAEIDLSRDAREAGALLGRLHREMELYRGELVSRDRAFYVDRYLRLLERANYPRAAAFAEYGAALWARIERLPRGFSHGDLYCGNLQKDPSGGLYLLDFDSACRGLPMYDLALLCNRTDYFEFRRDGYEKTAELYRLLLPEYLAHCPRSEAEIGSIYDMIALYHFALQATVIEFTGLEQFTDAFFDRQLDWLLRWGEQCEESERRDPCAKGVFDHSGTDRASAGQRA